MTDSRAAHIAPIDIARPEFAADFRAGYNRLRSECPVSWHPAARCWLVTRYDDASQLLRDKTLGHFGVISNWTRLRDRHGLDFPSAISVISHMPFNYEGEKHTLLRRAFARGIAPFADATEIFTARIQRTLHPHLADGGLDFASDFAGRLVFDIICDLAEIAESDRSALRPLSHASWAVEATAPLQKRLVFEAILKQVIPLLNDEVKRQLARSSTSLINAIYREVPPESDDKVAAVAAMLCVILLMGTDPFGGALTFGIDEILGDGRGPPGVPQSHWGGLTDEVLRVGASVDTLTRITTKETLVGGVTLAPGEAVLISPVAANRDPGEFGEDASTVIEARNQGVGLTFGAGAHLCIGMRLARNIMHAALEGLAGLPAMRRHGVARHAPGRVVRTFDTFPVEFE